MLKNLSISVCVLSIVLSAQAYAEEKHIKNFSVNPVLLGDGDDRTFGLDFQINGELVKKSLSSGNNDDLSNIGKTVFSSALVEYDLRGTYAVEKEKNPKNLIEGKVDIQYFRSSPAFDIKAGAFIEYESDQSFNDEQNLIGLTVTTSKTDVIGDNDYVALHLNYADVDPSQDTSREAILGPGLENYYRWKAEFLYKFIIGKSGIDDFEFNYRYYKEDDAPAAIKAASLDSYRLVTYRLGFMEKLFIAYSSGQLPFDAQSDKIYEIGFSHNVDVDELLK